MVRSMGGNLRDLMKQAQKMTEKLKEKQEELAGMEVEATAGGGMVTVKANGRQEITNINIEPEVVDPEDVEMLEDLILAAIREAQTKARELVEEEMGGLAKGLGLPNLPI
ncbi:MAG: YbaB/EbfC family nucleoid-associated protein [Candidatus Bipolaricaulia bacterium]